ncbi:MAG: hypothetical protein P4L84_25125 [Isosphaeraceae bacterium]|nr:hypothetical protein [Isosphaeraceae bacterium]
MHPGLNRTLGAAVLAPGLLVLSVWTGNSAADEPRGLGRLFRFGGAPAPISAPTPASSLPAPTSPLISDTGAPALPPPATSLPPTVATNPPVISNTPVSPTQRIVPQARTSRPVTDADPLVTRVSLVRSNDGNQFGVFLQVFADGTVIDGEGVHRVGRDALKPVLDALQESDLYRLKGHCGAPATDFTEYVHLVVFERNFGKLRANAFSYSGNPQGCDHAVRHLHGALDTLQTRISRPPAAGPGPAPGPGPANDAAAPPPPVNGANTIPLTPTN